MTLAFAEMLRIVAVNWKAVGSSLGLVIPSGRPSAAMFLFAGKLPYYYIVLAMTLAALAITWAIARSRLGYALVAVRENEDAAEAAGLDTLRVKLSGMAISSFLTALGGTFYAQYFAYIDPSLTFGVSVSIEGLLRAIVGRRRHRARAPARLLRPHADLGADPRGAARARGRRRHGVRPRPHPGDLVPPPGLDGLDRPLAPSGCGRTR